MALCRPSAIDNFVGDAQRGHELAALSAQQPQKSVVVQEPLSLKAGNRSLRDQALTQAIPWAENPGKLRSSKTVGIDQPHPLKSQKLEDPKQLWPWS